MEINEGPRFSIGLVAGDPQSTVRAARAIEIAGFDLLRVGDVPSTHREAYCSLTLCAVSTDSVRLGPGVSNPRTRHPALTASSIATLDEISMGRSFLGLGTGDSAVRNLGLKPASLTELEEYVDVVRALLTRGAATYRGDPLVMRSVERTVPVIIAAHGPKSLRLAGRIADGVVAGLGLTADAVEYALTHIEEGAREAQRTLADIEVWFLNYVNLGDASEDPLNAVAASVAAGGNLLARSPALATVPDRYRAGLRELAGSYRYSHHVDNSPGAANAGLVQDLGLLDYLAERFSITGDASSVIDGIRTVGRRGVTNFWCMYNRPDLDTFAQRWAADVMPAVKVEPE